MFFVGCWVDTWVPETIGTLKTPSKTLTIYGYKYSIADELAVRLNKLQANGDKKIRTHPIGRVLIKSLVPLSIIQFKKMKKDLSRDY